MHSAIYKYLKIYPEDVSCDASYLDAIQWLPPPLPGLMASWLRPARRCGAGCGCGRVPASLRSRPSSASRMLALPCILPATRAQHAFILTEPPLNTPENREHTAEVM